MKNKTTTTKDIQEFLSQTGYIHEMEVAEFLEQKGYQVNTNFYFFDGDEKKQREVDIIASKIINDIKVFLIIECKQNMGEDWVFICPKKEINKYPYFLKHLPMIDNEVLRNDKSYKKLHLYNQKIPKAINSTSFKKSLGNKKVPKDESFQIYEVVHKLPKIIVYVASQKKSDTRMIYLPVVVFKGDIFSASYNKSLVVKNKNHIQYEYDFKYPPYYTSNRLSFSPVDVETDKLKRTSSYLSPHYLIDFITSKGLNKYIEMLEKEVSSLDNNKWPKKHITFEKEVF